MKTVNIGGVGSVLLGDDGIGPYMVRLIESVYEFPANVSVQDLGTPGLDLIVHLCDVDCLILIDSVNNDEKPGTVTLYRKEDILRHGPAPVRVDPHAPVLSESLRIADFAGQGAEDVLLIGVTGEHYEVNQPISDAARSAASQVIAAVLAELDRLEIPYVKKPAADVCDIWWEPLSASESKSTA
jgi:hydrogenase maturation protease